MTNFTPEDILLYLYNETSDEQNRAIEAALEKEWTLREKMNVLKASMNRLDKLTESPRTEVVLNVLHHARENTVEVLQ
jgi:beta-galactosidase GanA